MIELAYDEVAFVHRPRLVHGVGQKPALRRAFALPVTRFGTAKNGWVGGPMFKDSAQGKGNGWD
jgi:hypothetical protein